MGEQRSDLPDPTEKVPPTASAASADDLLSQMAGEEIQRLLADIARQPPPPEPAAQPAGAAGGFVAPASDLDAETARQIDALFEKLTGSEFAQAPSQEAPPVESATPEQADPMALARETTPPSEKPGSEDTARKAEAALGAAPAPSAPSASDEPPAAAPAVAPKSAAPAPPNVDPAEQTTSLERQVLAAEVINAAKALSEEPHAPEPRPRDDGRLPFCLRPLEWLNAPVAGCSDAVRELMARIALATLAVSLFILIYVSFFRHQ